MNGLQLAFVFLTAVLASASGAEAVRNPPSAAPEKTFPALVVAEHIETATKLPVPSEAHPHHYIAFDSGFIEAGPPIAGEKPPAAAHVAQVLRAALATRHYEPASDHTAPSLVLIYHWGLVQPDSSASERGRYLHPNARARLSLVTTDKTLTMIRDGALTVLTPVSTIDLPVQSDAFERASAPRYFIVVSAYDYESFSRRNPAILWRVKLSAPTNTGRMDAVLPALIAAAGPHFGTRAEQPHFVDAVLNAAANAPPAGDRPAFEVPTSAASAVESPLLARTIRQERERFSGDFNRPAAPIARVRRDHHQAAAALPPELTARIAAYLRDKVALQAALNQKLREQPGDAKNNQTVDAFRAEHAAKVAALLKQREAIRGELARLSSRSAPAGAGQPLDDLLREFAGDIQQLDAHPFAARP